MSLEPRWHDLLDAAVPDPQSPPDALDRLTRAVNARRRRVRTIQASTAVAAVAVALILAITAPWTSREGRSDQLGPGPSSPQPAGTAPAGAVAYKCANDICLMRPDSTGKRSVGGGTYVQWDPAWSPDGRHLAFRGYYDTKEGTYAIYVVDADSCNSSRLPGTTGGGTPTWSSDGQRIAFA